MHFTLDLGTASFNPQICQILGVVSLNICKASLWFQRRKSNFDRVVFIVGGADHIKMPNTRNGFETARQPLLDRRASQFVISFGILDVLR